MIVSRPGTAAGGSASTSIGFNRQVDLKLEIITFPGMW